MSGPERPPDHLAAELFVAGERRRFGELTLEQVEGHAAELGAATGFGHRSRVGAVSAAWRRLGALMREREAATVAELPAEKIAELVEPLWIVPPGGSLLP